MLIELSNSERILLVQIMSKVAIENPELMATGIATVISRLIAPPPVVVTSEKTHEEMVAASTTPPADKKKGGRPKGSGKQKPEKSEEPSTQQSVSTNQDTSNKKSETPAESSSTDSGATDSTNDDNFFDPNNTDHKMILVDAMEKFDGDKDALRAWWKPWLERHPATATVEGLLAAFARCLEWAAEKEEMDGDE